MPAKTGRGRNFSTKFPSRAQRSARGAKGGLRRWQEAQPLPPVPKNPEVRIRAVRPSPSRFAKLRAVAASTSAKQIRSLRMTQGQFLGTLYTALTTYEYVKMEAEYKRRKAAGVRGVEADWAAIQTAAQRAFAAGGLAGVGPADLSRFSRDFNANRANRDAIIQIANTGKAVGTPSRLTGSVTATATLVPTVARIIDRFGDIAIPVPTICRAPIVQGSFTKHFGSSVSLSVRIRYWCPTWSNWGRMCTKTVTVAGVSWAVDVSVGYKLTCCGATVWGQGSVSACATIVGISLCATCTATITGVAGVSRIPTGTTCTYGLGISASLSCSLFGVNIFTASAPFGWTITGPCPPPGLNC